MIRVHIIYYVNKLFYILFCLQNVKRAKRELVSFAAPHVFKKNCLIFCLRKIPAWHLSYVHKQGVIFVYMSRSKNTVVACYTLEGQLVKTYQSTKLI